MQHSDPPLGWSVFLASPLRLSARYWDRRRDWLRKMTQQKRLCRVCAPGIVTSTCGTLGVQRPTPWSRRSRELIRSHIAFDVKLSTTDWPLTLVGPSLWTAAVAPDPPAGALDNLLEARFPQGTIALRTILLPHKLVPRSLLAGAGDSRFPDSSEISSILTPTFTPGRRERPSNPGTTKTAREHEGDSPTEFGRGNGYFRIQIGTISLALDRRRRKPCGVPTFSKSKAAGFEFRERKNGTATTTNTAFYQMFGT